VSSYSYPALAKAARPLLLKGNNPALLALIWGTAGTLTGVATFAVLATTTDPTGYLGAVGDTALIRLTGTDNDATCTDVTNCTVISSVSDLSGKVVLDWS